MTPLLRLLATSVLTAALLPACAAPKKTDAPQRPPLSQRADVQNWVADTAQRNNLDAQWSQAQLAQARAEAKALAVAQQHPDDTVIGCDTVVDCDGAVFGKPSGEEDAVRMLHALSGREHKVHTGLCVVHGGKAYLATETTRVQFAPIEESDLLAYARTPEPYDKAGAYAIQGHAALWCSGIVGCYYNIMGLPVHRLAQVLRQAGAL